MRMVSDWLGEISYAKVLDEVTFCFMVADVWMDWFAYSYFVLNIARSEKANGVKKMPHSVFYSLCLKLYINWIWAWFEILFRL